MFKYPAINALNNLLEKFNVKIKVVGKSDFSPSWFKVKIQIKDQQFHLHIDDEYLDFEIESKALHLCVILKSLEELKDAENFDHWCLLTGLESNANTRNYFDDGKSSIAQIESLIGELNSHISDYDFSLNAGEAKVLRSI